MNPNKLIKQTKLTTHYHFRHKSPAFTIVELLIVIVVIAILATISVIAYNGISQRAKIASLHSDLKNASTSLNLSKIENGSLPSNIPNSKPSNGATLSYYPDTGSGNFCIQGQYPDDPKIPTQYITQNGVINEGECNGSEPGGSIATSCFIFDAATKTITGYQDTSNCSRDVVIPSQIDGVSVERIGSEAFYDKKLTSLVISSSVRVLEDSAFHYNNLTSINIPGSVERIGNQAFSQQNTVTGFTLGDGVKVIGDGIFAGYSDIRIPELYIPDSVESIGQTAFWPNFIEGGYPGVGHCSAPARLQSLPEYHSYYKFGCGSITWR